MLGNVCQPRIPSLFSELPANMATPLNVRPHDVWLSRLISNGYLPKEIPPTFSSKGFGENAAELAKIWTTKIGQPWTAPEIYSISKHGHSRRNLSIVNPINQLQVSSIIAENWGNLKFQSNRSNTSVSNFQPELRNNGRSIRGSDFDELRIRHVKILATYDYFLKLDISRFYNSIYTHSIGWALFGKDWVKANFKLPEYEKTYGSKLDKAIAGGQKGQTIGIPIGPDTSRILSELILVQIESDISGFLGDISDRIVRNVDDFIIGIHQSEDVNEIISKISEVFYEYQLALNDEKTKISSTSDIDIPIWTHQIRSFRLSTYPNRQAEDIDTFFAMILKLADLHPGENIVLFALKKIANLQFNERNQYHVINWFIHFARKFPANVSYVVQYFVTLAKDTFVMPFDSIKAFLEKEIPIKAGLAHTDELAWLLYLARILSVKLDGKTFDRSLKLKSSVCAIQILHLRQLNLISGSIDDSFWRSFATKDGLNSEMWLIVYEATKRNWWKTKSPLNLTGVEYFKDLNSRDIFFYNTNLIVKRAFHIARPRIVKIKSGNNINWGASYF